jgi:hypothetical protein
MSISKNGKTMAPYLIPYLESGCHLRWRPAIGALGVTSRNEEVRQNRRA